MASGELAGLVEKPANWKKVYAIGYKSCSYDAAGKLPAKSSGSRRSPDQGQRLRLNDTLLWWIAGGIDAIELIAKARRGKRIHRLAKASSNTGTRCRNIPAISATTLSRRPSITAIRPKRS